MILRKFGYREKDKGNIIHQIVFPKEFANYRYFSSDFIKYLDKKLGVKIIFV